MGMTIPYVVEQTSRGERSYDIFSRLLNDRIIMLPDQVDNNSASLVIGQLLYLEGQDPDEGISFYINWQQVWEISFLRQAPRANVMRFTTVKL